MRYYLKNQKWEPGKNELTLKYVDLDPAKDAEEIEARVGKDLAVSVFQLLPDGHPKKPKTKK